VLFCVLRCWCACFQTAILFEGMKVRLRHQHIPLLARQRSGFRCRDAHLDAPRQGGAAREGAALAQGAIVPASCQVSGCQHKMRRL